MQVRKIKNIQRQSIDWYDIKYHLFWSKDNSVAVIYGQLLVLRSYLSTLFLAPSIASIHIQTLHFVPWSRAPKCPYDWHLAIFTHFYTPQLGLNTPSTYHVTCRDGIENPFADKNPTEIWKSFVKKIIFLQPEFVIQPSCLGRWSEKKNKGYKN